MPCAPLSSAVDATLGRWRREPFQWGRGDCILSVCDHVAAVTGIDPAAPWRGSYSDEAGAEAICREFGGVAALFAHGMARAGFIRADAASFGWPVAVRFDGHEIVGICTGDRLAFRHIRGVVELRLPVLGAWAV